MATKNKRAQTLIKLAEKEAAEREKLGKTRQKIAAELRAIRGDAPLDQVGTDLGMDPSTISVIERGKTFKPRTIQRLITYYAEAKPAS
jgi:transcriptional regulator with XRE-family HTH domain